MLFPEKFIIHPGKGWVLKQGVEMRKMRLVFAQGQTRLRTSHSPAP